MTNTQMFLLLTGFIASLGTGLVYLPQEIVEQFYPFILLAIIVVIWKTIEWYQWKQPGNPGEPRDQQDEKSI